MANNVKMLLREVVDQGRNEARQNADEDKLGRLWHLLIAVECLHICLEPVHRFVGKVLVLLPQLQSLRIVILDQQSGTDDGARLRPGHIVEHLANGDLLAFSFSNALILNGNQISLGLHVAKELGGQDCVVVLRANGEDVISLFFLGIGPSVLGAACHD